MDFLKFTVVYLTFVALFFVLLVCAMSFVRGAWQVSVWWLGLL